MFATYDAFVTWSFFLFTSYVKLVGFEDNVQSTLTAFKDPSLKLLKSFSDTIQRPKLQDERNFKRERHKKRSKMKTCRGKTKIFPEAVIFRKKANGCYDLKIQNLTEITPTSKELGRRGQLGSNQLLSAKKRANFEMSESRQQVRILNSGCLPKQENEKEDGFKRGRAGVISEAPSPTYSR